MTDYEALEREHLGDPDKRTGIYAPKQWRCAHGLGLSDQCSECDLDSAREVLGKWGEAVDAARKVIADSAGKSVMLKVGGKPFRCGCGCNVFHRLGGEKDEYRCNACEIQYEAQ